MTDDGAALLSWGHMIEALNKLDVGSPEKIVLLSRNEADMLVVSYADMKRCLESCFAEVLASAGTDANSASQSRRGSLVGAYQRY